jgi:hypothetical protein
MKLVKAEGMATPFALHIANKHKILTIVEMGTGKIKHGGIPAVLTDGVSWFSAELIEDPTEALYVAAAVNMYGDKNTARRQAEGRGNW